MFGYGRRSRGNQALGWLGRVAGMGRMPEDELARLARSPRECVAEALAEGPDAFRAEVTAWEHRYRRGLRGLQAWIEGSAGTLARLPGGPAALARVLGDGALRAAAANDVQLADLEVLGERQAASVVDLDGYDVLEAGWCRVHDARVDLVSLLWTAVQEVGGREALESVLRSLAEESLLRWMVDDLTLTLEDRLREWAAVMRANFTQIAIAEHAEGFTITSDPCGSCSRQLSQGRAAAEGLATVEPFSPEHVGADPVPVYRSHVGLMHWLMPIERTGAPWPVIHCPSGTGWGPCRLILHEDPSTAI
jgi:hypothetical protein